MTAGMNHRLLRTSEKASTFAIRSAGNLPARSAPCCQNSGQIARATNGGLVARATLGSEDNDDEHGTDPENGGIRGKRLAGTRPPRLSERLSFYVDFYKKLVSQLRCSTGIVG